MEILENDKKKSVIPVNFRKYAEENVQSFVITGKIHAQYMYVYYVIGALIIAQFTRSDIGLRRRFCLLSLLMVVLFFSLLFLLLLSYCC